MTQPFGVRVNDKLERTEADRLEDLWAGDFGEEYRRRNVDAGKGRGPFWRRHLTRHPARTVLEIGCNNGANLRWILGAADEVWGVDVNQGALDDLKAALPDVQVVRATARALPFEAGSFDLVFTAGVLIHQPESTLGDVMSEMVRVSRRHVMALEYAAAETREVPYRGQQGALFKRDYKSIFLASSPTIRHAEEGFLPASQGWDDVTWWLFEKPTGEDSG